MKPKFLVPGLTMSALLFAITLNNALSANAAPGAIFTVTQTADLVDANLGDNRCDTNLASAGDQCSLRAAIQQANSTTTADTIKFVSTAAHTLTRLAAGVEENKALSGDLDITQNVTLEPNPGGKTIVTGAVNFDDRIFDIRGNAQVTFKRLEIRGGHTGGFGGGIRVNPGTTLTLVDSVVANNSAQVGGGIANGGTLELFRTTINLNLGLIGGGIFNSHSLKLVESTVSRNTATADGGGLDNSLDASVANIVNSTFSGNEARRNGGGILNESSTLNLFNVTLASNTADQDNNLDGKGGGLFTSAAVTIANTVIANNTDLSGNQFAPDCFGTLNSNGFNAVENGNGCNITGNTTGNRNGTDPKLGRLKDNGGSTKTHALSAASILIDAGNPNGCQDNTNVNLTTDQRGFPRPTDGNGDGTARCDIGAFEVGAVGIGAVSPTRGSSNAGERVVFDLAWDSPTRWRDLTSLDLRFKRQKDTLLWLRFSEGLPNSTISLLDEDGNVVDSGNVGEARKLKNKFGSVSLKQSGFTASGPDDPHVVVHFAVKFKARAEGKSKIQMLATDDFGNAQGPEPAGKWKVRE